MSMEQTQASQAPVQAQVSVQAPTPAQAASTLQNVITSDLPKAPPWLWVMVPLSFLALCVLIGYFVVMALSYGNDHAWVALGAIALFLSGFVAPSPVTMFRR